MSDSAPPLAAPPPPGPGPRRRPLLLLWLAAIVLLCILSLGALAALPSRPLVFRLPLDKFLHAAAYAGLAVLSCAAFRRASSVLTALLFLLALSLALEISQFFTPPRQFDLADLASNALGLALGALLGLLQRRARNRRTATPPKP